MTTTTHYQYSDYSSNGTDYYGNYYNQSHPSHVYNSNGHYNQISSNLQIANNNNNSSEYQSTAPNWNHLHYNQQLQNYSQQRYDMAGTNNNFQQYSNNNNNNNEYYQQINRAPSSHFTGNPHLFSNHNYPVNRTMINDYGNDKQNTAEGYGQKCQSGKSLFKNVDFAYDNNKVSSVNNNHVEASAEHFHSEIKNEKRKRTEEIDDKDSPALRALLTNKNLRYSPNYIDSFSHPKRRKPVYDPSQKTNFNGDSKPNIDNVTLSPHKTEDSLDFFDNFTNFPNKTSLQQQQSTPLPDTSIKSGFEYTTQPMVLNKGFSPPDMTCENLSSPASQTTTQTSSPMSKLVEGLSTPPLSPKEADGVNQNVSKLKSDTSSSSALGKQCTTWEQDGMAECKYIVTLKTKIYARSFFISKHFFLCC